MVAVAFLCGAAAAFGPTQAHALKNPPIYEDGQVSTGATEWLRDYSTDVEAEFNLAEEGRGSRLSNIFGKAGKFAPRVLGAVGLAFGAYEICDEFFRKGCWLVDVDEATHDYSGGTVPRYGPCVVPSSSLTVGSFNCAGTTIVGKYPELVGAAVYVSPRGPWEALGNHELCDQPAPDGWAPEGYALDSDSPTTCIAGGVPVPQNLGVAYQYARQITEVTPPDPTTPDRSGVPNIDVVEHPLPATFLPDFGDELDLTENDDIEEQMEPLVPRTIPAPLTTETFEQYRDRLIELGFLGDITRVDLTDATLDPTRGPNVAVRTSPAVGTIVQPEDLTTTDIDVHTNPATAPDPVIGGGGPIGCDTPTIRAFDFGPLMIDPGDKFPFGVFAWLDGTFGGFFATAEAPRIEIPMPGDIDPLVIDFDTFSPIMDWLHPAILLLAFFSLLYLLATSLLGLGRVADD